VRCTVAFPPGKPRYDWTNLAAAAKLVEDGLVEAGVLREDGPTEIRRGTLEATRRDEDGYRVHFVINALES